MSRQVPMDGANLCHTCGGSLVEHGGHNCVLTFAARAANTRDALDRALYQVEQLQDRYDELRACAHLVLMRLPAQPWRQHTKDALDALERLVKQ